MALRHKCFIRGKLNTSNAEPTQNHFKAALIYTSLHKQWIKRLCVMSKVFGNVLPIIALRAGSLGYTSKHSTHTTFLVNVAKLVDFKTLSLSRKDQLYSEDL